MGRVLAAILATLLLGGCAVVSAPAPGLTDGQYADARARELDLRWQLTLLPDDLRPPDPVPHAVRLDGWAIDFAACMNNAGFMNYSAHDGALTFTEVAMSSEQVFANDVALYVCENSMQLEESDPYPYNPAQIDYLYDYYKDVLVPCLRLRGVELVGVPTHDQFVDELGAWSPYQSVASRSSPLAAGIFDECPRTPPGMPDAAGAENAG